MVLRTRLTAVFLTSPQQLELLMSVLFITSKNVLQLLAKPSRSGFIQVQRFASNPKTSWSLGPETQQE